MHTLKMVTLVVFAGLIVSAPALADEKLDAVEKEIIAKWKEVKSMSAKMNMNMDMDQGGMKMKSTMTGTTEYLRKGDKMMTRLEGATKMTMGGAQQAMESKLLMVSDGEFTYTLNEQMGQKMCMKNKADKNTAGGADMLEGLREQYNLILADDEDVDGEKCWVVLGTPKVEQPNAPAKFKYYFQKKTGAAVQWLGYDASDKVMMTTKFTDIKLNEKIDAERFVFKAPEGVEVMDMTGAP